MTVYRADGDKIAGIYAVTNRVGWVRADGNGVIAHTRTATMCGA